MINTYEKERHIHLIGIGGIGVSGLAEMMLSRGYRVSGSDMKASPITHRLEQKGARIFVGHAANQVTDADLVVYTAAVRDDNPELLQAKLAGIPAVNRAEMLGMLMREYAKSLAIAGTHGKTTTTSMISVILEKSGLDPTMLIGGDIREIQGNAKAGKTPFLVAEACEYKDSFLSFHPYGAIILNIEEDHLDYFRNLEHIIESFSKFTSQITTGGFMVYNNDDAGCRRLQQATTAPALSFGLGADADCTAQDITFSSAGCATFTLMYRGQAMGPVTLNVPGMHNVYNALAAIATSLYCGATFQAVQESLSTFEGARRRFDHRGFFNGALVVDDYAHHPTEIRATLAAAARTNHNKIWCIFQPHTYTRTAELMQEFSQCFGGAHQVIITRIYAARETDTLRVHGRDLVEKIVEAGENAIYLDTFPEIIDYLREVVSENDLILTVGAGNIDDVAQLLTECSEK